MIIAYKDLTNAESIIENIAMINPRIVVVDLSLVVSAFHLQLATYKALLNESQGRMKTKSIQSEVLYQLSSSTKITDALQQYTIHAQSKEICFIHVAAAGASTPDSDAGLTVSEFQSIVGKLTVNGVEIDPMEISSTSILTGEKTAKIVKYFKITPLELEVSGLEESVSTRLAVKNP